MIKVKGCVDTLALPTALRVAFSNMCLLYRNQVAPSELEGILGSHGLVLGAAVCGYFDDTRQTERPIGYVVLSPSVAPNERDRVLDEIRTWVDGQVAPYKRLRGGLHSIDALPKNPTGKLMRSQLPIKLAEKRKARI